MTDEAEIKSSQWVVHILGPDDVIDQPDELTALREANGINKMIARKSRRPDDPFILAILQKTWTQRKFDPINLEKEMIENGKTICNFCGRSSEEVSAMISKHEHAICDRCVTNAYIICEEFKESDADD